MTAEPVASKVDVILDRPLAVPFWRPVSVITKPTRSHQGRAPAAYERAIALDPKDFQADPSRRPPAQQPLCAWSRLWPFLRSVLGAVLDHGALDIPRIIWLAAQMRPMPRLPRLLRRGWARRCLIIVDTDTRLVPFWRDTRQLCDNLSKIRGIAGLSLLLFENGPFGPVRIPGKDGPIMGSFKLPEPGTPVLILSDLGLFDRTGRAAEEWLRFGKKLRRSGFAPVVLTPAPRRLWTEELTAVFRLACWDRGQRLPRLTSSSPAGSRPLTSDKPRQTVELLMTMLSAAIRVEPELLRAVRLLLPLDQADAGDEAAVWQHEHVRRASTGFGFDAQAVGCLRQAFTALPGDLKMRVCDLIQAHHRHLSPAVYYEECLIADRCGVALAKLREAETYFWRCLKSYDRPGFDERVGYEAFTLRAAHRHEKDATMWAYDVLSAAHARVNLEAWTRGRIVLPKGLDPARVAWVWAEDGPPERYTLLQQGPHLVAQRPLRTPPANMPPMTGSPVVDLTSSDGVLQVQSPGDENGTLSYAVNLKRPTPVPIELPDEGQLFLSTTRHEITLERTESPPWAMGWGRDERGLFVILPRNESTRKAYWLAPGMYPVGEYAADSIALDDSLGADLLDGRAAIPISRGFWWDEDDFEAAFRTELHRSGGSDLGSGFGGRAYPGFQKPEWATDYGVDEYGIYAAFQYKGVSQGLRWIMPGEFMMGSPGSEPERGGDEQQHKVILTRGFWMADTACTQALWQAVMGENPSRFRSDDRPVESISWDHCQRFIARLNAAVPGLNMHLPTEAQWEYACRAGTTTVFHFGDAVSTDQANFDGNYPYNKGPKGQFREGTVSVKSLPCNGWGLYEMHGNVWEWCADCYGPYPEETVVDPTGPNEGSGRVLRGGSWFSYGWFVRSALRNENGPAFRSDSYGLRLARGQTSPAGTGSGGAGQSKSAPGAEKKEPSKKRDKGKTTIFDWWRKK